MQFATQSLLSHEHVISDRKTTASRKLAHSYFHLLFPRPGGGPMKFDFLEQVTSTNFMRCHEIWVPARDGRPYWCDVMASTVAT